MKIHINEDSKLEEMEITINCKRLDRDIEKIISLLRVTDMKITGMKDNQVYILDAAKVLYIDTVDKKTFLYTKEAVYETELRLYELEDRLGKIDFLRANKSAIINFNRIHAIKADLDGRLLVTLSGGEKIFVSRQYAPDFKKKLEG